MKALENEQTSIVGAEIAALMLRLSLGTMYIAHALYKTLVLTLPGAMRLFASTGMPGWSAYPAIAAELIGGACLILGVKVRWVAVLLMPMLVGAILFVHGGHGWIYTSPGGGWEYLAFLMVVSVAIACLGSGPLALERFWKGLDPRGLAR